jgi:hypothetical protein
VRHGLHLDAADDCAVGFGLDVEHSGDCYYLYCDDQTVTVVTMQEDELVVVVVAVAAAADLGLASEFGLVAVGHVAARCSIVIMTRQYSYCLCLEH